jgi:hypothetical protein
MRKGLFIFALIAAVFSTVSLYAADDAQTTLISEEPGIQWQWGEVVSVKPGDRLITVRYIDPESDKAMTMVLSVDDKTKFENAVSIDDIKPENSISFTYVVAAAGQNIAKSVNLEKIEEISVTSENPFPGQEQPVVLPQTVFNSVDSSN